MHAHNHISHIQVIQYICLQLYKTKLLVGLSQDDKHQVWFSAHHSAGIS